MQPTNTREQYIINEEHYGQLGSAKWTVQFSAPTRRRPSNFDGRFQSQDLPQKNVAPVAKTIIEQEYDKLVSLEPDVATHNFNPYFICSVSMTLMFDPVIVIESGQTYDRQSIQRWFINSTKDPMTGAELERKDLIPNLVLKQQILDCLQTMQESLKTKSAPTPGVRLT